MVDALKAARFAGWIPYPLDGAEIDNRSEQEARDLAEHGARLAIEAGFVARPLWMADDPTIADTIIEEGGDTRGRAHRFGLPWPDWTGRLLRDGVETRPAARVPADPRRPSTETTAADAHSGTESVAVP